MGRIKLIVTGDLEKLALHESLRSLFPAAPVGEPGDVVEAVIWDRPRKLHCATSHRLTSGKAPSVPMLDLVQAMMDEACVGKRGVPADLVVVMDDVELGNLGQEAVILEHFRAAVNQKLDSYEQRTRARYRAILRERCSFHLLCPMVEAYLFGDPAALAVAGVPPSRTPLLVSTDVEQFESNDPAWLPECVLENEVQGSLNPWWRNERHPKRYLEHLLGETVYEETEQGKRALLELRWRQVPKSPAETSMLRCLLEDIATWFGVPNPLGAGGSLFPGLYPARNVRDEERILRNF